VGFIGSKEEIDHFDSITLSKWKLGRERKDEYVNELYLYMKKSSDG
jgi:tRNA-(ms[2]io[6]A)-hydroxylase